MTDSGKAVFLSYASQDTEAASRICEALRAAGIEVWFDRSELRGGDAWDQKIRREIRECALFIPLISANTAARAEGYFRLEWSLAEARSHMIARNKAFIVPVCLDQTPEPGADVPESFQRVQWTRLPHGDTPPAFTARIIALLVTPGADATRFDAAARPVGPATRAPVPTAKATHSLSRLSLALIAVLGAGLLYLATNKSWLAKHVPAEPPAATVLSTPPPAVPAIPDKSVAVMPFVDMSEKKDQEYFSDGLSEELIDMLTKVPDLRVPARTSSFYFKGKQATIADIAKVLGVAHVLEGSVRKSGNTLRITAQLIRADNGYHIWSETYDRRLDDIFRIQDEIAEAVVKALKISLMAGIVPDSTGTQNVEAYNLYLQAKSINVHANEPADREKAVEYLRRSLQIDPKFANAWASLAASLYGSPREEARRAAQQALMLNPRLPDAHTAMAIVLFFDYLDVGSAETQIQQALQLDPNNSWALGFAGVLASSKGQFAKAIELLHKSIASDPVNPTKYRGLAMALYYSGNYSEALVARRKALDLNPGGTREDNYIPWAVFLLSGQPAAALSEVDSDSRLRENCGCLVLAYDALGRNAEANAALAKLEKNHANDNAQGIARVYASRGDLDQAFKWFDRAYRQREEDMLFINVDPLLKKAQSDPRINVLLRKMNLL